MWADAKVAGDTLSLDQMLQAPEVFYGGWGAPDLWGRAVSSAGQWLRAPVLRAQAAQAGGAAAAAPHPPR